MVSPVFRSRSVTVDRSAWESWPPQLRVSFRAATSWSVTFTGGRRAGRSPETSVLSNRTEMSHQKISKVAFPRMCSGRGPESSPATDTLNRFFE